MAYIFILGLAPSYETHVGSKQIKQLVSSDAFKEFAQSTKRLKYVDLSRLENDNQKLSFMINLHNLLFLHGILIIVSGTIESLPSIDQSDLHKWTYESLMKHPAGRLAVDQYLAYHVGQLGVFRFVLVCLCLQYCCCFYVEQCQFLYACKEHCT